MSLQCRSCTSTNATKYVELLSELADNISYLEYFNQCTQLNAKIDDGLPSSLCSNCSHDLQVSYDFVRLAKQADAAFRGQQEQVELMKEFKEEQLEVLQYSNESGGEEEMHDDGTNDEQIIIEEVLQEHIEGYEEDHETTEAEISEDIVAEELLECEEDDIIQNEHLEVDSLDVVSLEELNEIDSCDEKLMELLEESQKDMKSVEASCVNGDYYPEDEADDEYQIECDEASDDDDFEPTVAKKWKCTECKCILRGDVSYEGHMNMHKDIRPYACKRCQCAFRCKESLQRHTQLRHQKAKGKTKKDSKLQDCEMGKESESEEAVQVPSKVIEFANGTAQCPHCGEVVDSDKLPNHVRWQHSDVYRIEPYNQDTDDSSTPAANNLNADNAYYMCNFCNENFLTIVEMREHMRTTHADKFGKVISFSGEPIEECKICKRKLLKRNIAKHMENHESRGERPSPKYLCAYCSRECKNLKTLNQHERMHHGENADIIYVCGDCNRQYNTQNLLEQHRKIAHKERDHVCQICGNAFKLKNQLVNHMKLHLEKNIQCPQCDKKYARQFDLNVHMRTHTGELPYACHLCEKRFAIKVRLTYHLQKHYGIKHSCKECGAEFNSKQKLKAHSFKHTGMPYRCEMCNDHGFANRDVFKRHLLRVHKATMADEALTEMFQRNTGKTIKIRTIDELDPALVSSVAIIEEMVDEPSIAMEMEVGDS